MWNGALLAETAESVQLEGNHYFPVDSLHREYFSDSATTSVCPWKGTAHYYSVTVDGKLNADAAWYYPEPKAKAGQIKDHVAFWKGVQVESD